MELNTEGTSRETQLRMLKLYKVILAKLGGGKGDIFTFGYKTMRKRWIKLNQVVSLSKLFSLQKLPTSQYCNYFNTTRHPSPGMYIRLD